MTDRQTIIDLFEKHADWHNDLAWIEVGAAADLVVDLEDTPHPDDAAMATIGDILTMRPNEALLAHPNVAFNDTGAPIGIDWQNILAHNKDRPTEDELSGEDG